MRQQLIGIVTALAFTAVPTIAQAAEPVRASSAMAGTTGVVAGASAGIQSGVQSGMGAGAGGGMSSVALAGLALGLTGVALATYIATHKHKHCNNGHNDRNCSPSPR